METSEVSPVGQVFTPLKWAKWLIHKWNLFDAWQAGASLCDPTAGQGAFALALFSISRERGLAISSDMLARLGLIEIQKANSEAFERKIADMGFDFKFPEDNLVICDIITNCPDKKYDILIGNPPWSNFAKLPSDYKEELKKYYIKTGLVSNKKEVLLGSSRIDIAALILKIVLGKLLNKNGAGYFYLPLSLFSGDNAHAGFRNYQANNKNFSIEEVYEFRDTKVFEDIGTAYCAAKISVDRLQKFPVKYYREEKGDWSQQIAMPLKNRNDQWRILCKKDEIDVQNRIEINLSPKQKPRQGVNTCGANSVFIFSEKPAFIPEKYIYPLATKELWKNGSTAHKKLTKKKVYKWIFLPYEKKTGHSLSLQQMAREQKLQNYLTKYKDLLSQRKGTLIQSAIQKGLWWSLLGIGPYSFAPYKVIWQAYGQSEFKVMILDQVDGQVWQGNQAMQAFIPSWNKAEAYRIKSALKNPAILTLLKQLNGAGKCNWAQPGKIKKILSFHKDSLEDSLSYGKQHRLRAPLSFR